MRAHGNFTEAPADFGVGAFNQIDGPEGMGGYAQWRPVRDTLAPSLHEKARDRRHESHPTVLPCIAARVAPF
jgi:hypothetical protein